MRSRAMRTAMIGITETVQAVSQAGALIEPDKHLIYLRCEMLVTKLSTAG